MLYLAKSLLADTFYRALHIRRKPVVIQMPVTSRCNSRCLTCNVWKTGEKTDIDPAALRLALQDRYFSAVRSVGLNGGELTLVKQPEEIVKALFVLKKLDYIHVISNGLLPARLLNLLKEIRQLAAERNIRLGFTLSVDGVGGVHNRVRGVPEAFARTRELMDELAQNRDQYCDVMDIGCTLSKYNLPYVQESDAFFRDYPFPVTYHLAVPNKRIYTFGETGYYVLGDERSRLLAAEFFYGKFLSTSLAARWRDKFCYFANYYFLKNGGHGRLSQCPYLNRDVTIDERLDLFLCATASDRMGNLAQHTASELRRQGCFGRMERTTAGHCDTCIHYVGLPTLKGALLFGREMLNYRWSWGRKFKLLTQW